MIARSMFFKFFFCVRVFEVEHKGSLGVISGQFCMINHAPEEDERRRKKKRKEKKSHLLSVHREFMLKEIKGDRQRDERIDIFSSPFGSLWEEENYFKAAALMKEKGVMADVSLQRWNQQYEWLKGREGEEEVVVGGVEREHLFEGTIFCWGNESAIWQWWRKKQRFPCQRIATGSTLQRCYFRCVHIEQKQKQKKNAADVIS